MNSCSAESFTILDSAAATKFQIKIKEALRINWEKPAFNQQLQHVIYLFIFPIRQPLVYRGLLAGWSGCLKKSVIQLESGEDLIHFA